jgi:elongation factor Ts
VAGKPPAAIEKIVAGKLEKFYGEICLLDQVFVIDNSKKTVGELLAEQAAKNGVSASLTRFKRFQIGLPSE